MTSLGEDRVRVQFNPNQDGIVHEFKQHTADLINKCEAYKVAALEPEEKRLWAEAQTCYELAAMWAVKAATYG